MRSCEADRQREKLAQLSHEGDIEQWIPAWLSFVQG
jgi:hypothetical protein